MTHDNSGAHAREPRAEPAHTTPRVEEHTESRTPAGYSGATTLPTHTRPHELVSWGAVWAGLLITLAVFLLLEFIFLALGWLTFSQGQPGSTAGVVSAILALVAFFIGGMTAGATSIWRNAKGGLLHGLLVWALGTVAIIFLTLFGGGALLGSVATVMAQASSLQQAGNVPDVQLQEALSTARTAAGWASLSVVLPLASAALGGLLGGKIGPKNRKTD